MAIPQQKFREIVFQLLYSADMGHGNAEDIMQLLMKELSVTKKTVKEALERVHLIQKKLAAIDEDIRKTSQSYSFERIQSVERNILRLGVFELFHDETIPPKVAIAEAMRLARKFGSPESASFVNAVMDALYKSSLGEKVDPQTISQTVSALEESEKLAKKALEDAEKSKKEQA